MNTGYPSISDTIKMTEIYLAHGVKAIQFDLPSRNPYRETDFIKMRMAGAYERYGGYEEIMNRLSTFRSEHPDFEMQMVSYEDVLVTVGTRSYIDFCRKNRIKTCRISGDGVIERARMDMNRAGIDTLTFIDYNMREEDVSFARETGRAVMLRNVRAGMEARSDMKSWTDRIGYLRERGITAPIYATAGITCGQDILEVKAAGAAGAFVGSCLMKLWEDEKNMLLLLEELERAANNGEKR